MGSELYSSLAGATAAQTHLEVLADNIANADTAGFKARRLAYQSAGGGGAFGDMYAQVTQTYEDFSAGALRTTGDAYDIALEGEGFLTVETGPATRRYLRTGRLEVDADGFLGMQGAGRLIADGGLIQLEPGETFRIAEDGTVIGSDQGELGRLDLAVGDATPLGDGQWEAGGEMGWADGVAVRQGAIEGSNVDPLKTMVELVQASRHFEAYQKAMQASDELDARLNRLGGQ